MNTGKMRHRITLQSQTSTTGDYGGVDVVWADEKTVWANIKPLTANEVIYSEKVDMRVTHKIIIRYNSDIKPSWRVKYRDRVFNIYSIINKDELNRTLELLSEEVIDG